MRTKVTVVSSDKKSLQDITRALARDTDLGEISSIEGNATALERIVDAPDLLIINGALAEEGGLDTLERLGHLHPETAFIVVSENQSSDFLLRAMRAGVRDAIAKVDARNIAGTARPPVVTGALPTSFLGGPDTVVEQVRRRRDEVDAGVLDLSLQPPGSGDPDALLRSLELFGKTVLPRIREI